MQTTVSIVEGYNYDYILTFRCSIGRSKAAMTSTCCRTLEMKNPAPNVSHKLGTVSIFTRFVAYTFVYSYLYIYLFVVIQREIFFCLYKL